MTNIEEFLRPQSEVENEGRKMEKLIKEAEGILFAKGIQESIEKEVEETVGPEQFLEESRRILNKEAVAEIEFIEKEFSDFFKNPERVERFAGLMAKNYHWDKSQTQAMLYVLENELNNAYRDVGFPSPDEKNPKAGGRDLKTTLLGLTEHDYGKEVTERIKPLIDIYIEGAKKSLEQRRKS